MCELFGVCANKPQYINDYLKKFYCHSQSHPHGWGLACINGDDVNIEKEPIQALKSHYLKHRLSLPIQSPIVLAHIRYATIGNVEYVNCHPYSMRDRFGIRWTLIHNGTIFQYPILDKYVQKQKGSTDSERILLYIIDQFNKQDHLLNTEERCALLDYLITDMSKGNKLNLVLTDGDNMYVHTNYADSLYSLYDDKSVIFSTKPLTHDDWTPVAMMTLLVYRDGKLLYTGTKHDYQYYDDQDNTRYLYQIFSDL